MDRHPTDGACWNAATCILFGDASGAVVMQAQTGDCALLGSCMRSDGTGHKHLKVGAILPALL